MGYRETMARLDAHRREIADIRARMRAVQQEVEPQPVRDYVFADSRGPVRLSGLFGSRRDLIIIHNMGVHCPYCTVWADGCNGVYEHLSRRAGFAVVGPDAPSVQRAFAAERRWQFPYVSHAGTSFAKDMGYAQEDGRFLPGISVFRKQADGIVRVSDAGVEPGCDFSPVDRLFELFPDGWAEWKPKLRY